jgi:nucleotide-binding universal stress UspA family protein
MLLVVVAVDGSETANHAAQFGAKLARATGAQLTLLFVYDAPAAAMLGIAGISASDLESARTAVAEVCFSAARAAIGDSGVVVKTEVLLGHPGREIVAYAKAHKADLLVLGRRGVSHVSELILGSVSEYVVRYATCPVTITRQ